MACYKFLEVGSGGEKIGSNGLVFLNPVLYVSEHNIFFFKVNKFSLNKLHLHDQLSENDAHLAKFRT